jgi:hypothetical protein
LWDQGLDSADQGLDSADPVITNTSFVTKFLQKNLVQVISSVSGWTVIGCLKTS